jgi:hypothetical protein
MALDDIFMWIAEGSMIVSSVWFMRAALYYQRETRRLRQERTGMR